MYTLDILGIGNSIREAGRTIALALFDTLLRLIAALYDLFNMIASHRLFDDNVIQTIYTRVGLVLGLFMVFRLTFSAIEYLINPDNITDKQKGIGNIIKKVLIVVILLGSVHFLFNTAYSFQDLLLNDENNVISKVSFTSLFFLVAPKLPILATIALKNSSKGYLLPCNIWDLEDKVKDILSIGNQTGEGWFLTAEMIEYIENDIPNIVCVQPFACLPNHVVGKGVIKTIRNKFPEANISPIDYDPGASEANQTNRLKLLMTVAKDNLIKQENEKNALLSENSLNTIDNNSIKK